MSKRKFGVADNGVNFWEGGLFSMEKRIDDMKRLGFAAIERPEVFDANDAIAKAALFRQKQMEFTTIVVRNNRPELGLQIAAALRVEYIWFDVKKADRSIDLETFCRYCRFYSEQAERLGVRAALHNHLSARIENQEELEIFLKECPKAGLILDVGHLQAAGGDPVGTILKHIDRIVAVHYKDARVFNPQVGIDRYRDRLRFCGIGEGNIGVDFKAVSEALKKVDFSGWIFVEHDDHTDSPQKQLVEDMKIMNSLF